LDVTRASLDRAAGVEPNRSVDALAGLRLDFVGDDTAMLEDVTRFLHERRVLDHPLSIESVINLDPLRAALKRFDLPALAARVEPR
jgi:hypothetical protein